MTFVLRLSFLILIAGSIAAEAQGVTVAGVVLDETGALVPLVKVKAGHAEKIVETRTNEVGEYSLRLLPGLYSLEFSFGGFKTHYFKKYRVANAPPDHKMNLDVVLEVAMYDNCGVAGCVEESVTPICHTPPNLSEGIVSRPLIKTTKASKSKP